MRISSDGLMRQIAGGLTWLMLVPFVAATILPEQETNPGGSAATVTAAQPQSQKSNGEERINTEPSPQENLPSSPGSVRTQTGGENRDLIDQGASSQHPRAPVGTAAAESVETTGVAGSNPAGAAIAPAKQRRTRAILIKVGAIVGAGAAIGAVAALSSGSPSRPPGAR